MRAVPRSQTGAWPPGILKVMKLKVSIPVYVMIRPRGGDFCYSEVEFTCMSENLSELKKAGADGFVFGILNEDGTVNENLCRLLIGGGITERNLHRILEGSGAKEFHGSARSSQESCMLYRKPGVPMGAALTPPEFNVKVTNVEKVNSFLDIAKNVWKS
ncbi:CUTC-like protein [Mya arenaria]|uniref:Copper homeostasis protein cutC homolog n=1 Tax=Mya arenaria TaxID=6604 RepID=A0ABY7FFR8_MYAAR|nr:CUTC-like protein [Mya arenaria]